MKIQTPNPIKKNLREIKPYSIASSAPSLALIRKTLIFDLCTIKRIIISVFALVLPQALILAFAPPFSGEQYILQLLGFTTWYYNFAIMFPIIIIGSTGPLISEELRSGTLLFLVSKPISRTKIILSKFIALLIFGITISFLSLSVICIIALIKYSFIDIGLYLGIFFIYGLVITLFFGGITIGFSSIFSRPRNVLLIPLALVIFSFLVFMMFKPLLYGPDNWYEDLFLYNFDIGYHFSNIFLWIGESFDPEILNYFALFFWMFGITKMVISDGWEITYVKNNYYHPVVSLLFLIAIAGILIIIGIISLKRRDLS